MPGSGKSTVGIVLAKKTARNFVDTDVLIQTRENRGLQEIVDTEGYLELRRIEEQVLIELAVTDHVVATGGSAVYSARAMEHLATIGKVVFLDVSLQALRARVRDFDSRGLARPQGQTVDELFEERLPLYREWAHVTVDGAGGTHEEIAGRILRNLETFSTHRPR